MKNKKVKKISKKIFGYLDDKYILKKKRLNSYPNESREVPAPMMEEEFTSDYDSEVSLKFKKMFTNIIKYPDNIRIQYTSSYISIEISNIKYIKNSRPINNNNSMIKSNGDEQLNIYILKDKHFSVSQGYNKTSKYTDVNMYNDMIEITKNKVKEVHASNFNSIWESIAIESGILRDSNLDDILN